MKKVFLVFGLIWNLAAAAPFTAPSATPATLARAQQAYLEGNFPLALSAIKQAYMVSANDSVAQKNTLRLFSQVRSKAPNAEVGWTLPSEILTMRVAVSRRFENNLVTHLLVIGGGMKSLDEMTSFQLLRYPDTVVLDKAKKIGNFQEKQEEDTPTYDYRTKPTPFDISSGLYLLTFTTKSGSRVDGWFILDENANSTSQPQITNMDGNPILTTGTPKMEWLDFTSPQYKKDTEYRSLAIWVSPPGGEKGAYSYWTKNMNETSNIIASQPPEDQGFTRGPLGNGDYYALLSFDESQKFGPIRLARRSSTIKYFSVKR